MVNNSCNPFLDAAFQMAEDLADWQIFENILEDWCN